MGCGQELGATDEASLLAMARESEEGKVLVAPGAEIALTKTLFVCEEPPDWHRENFHCEPRPFLRSAGCGGGWG